MTKNEPTSKHNIRGSKMEGFAIGSKQFCSMIEGGLLNKLQKHYLFQTDSNPFGQHVSGIRNLKNLNDENDITIRTIKEEKELPYSELTGSILGCCFEVMKELGPGFLERVYKNALLMAMREKGLQVEVERSYNVIYSS